MSAAPDIFLSYNREDVGVAKLFADAFAAGGLEVWWDQTLRSGETYDEVTEAALRGAKAVVVLWSPRSAASHWVRAEATIAHRAKTLVPATIAPCDKPVMFELTQTADLAHWRGEPGDPAWLAFLGDVRRMAEKEALAPVPAVQAATGAPASAGFGVPQAGVLPFTLRGHDEELEFLAEDLTEDVTRVLAENDYFKVIASRTMAGLRGRELDYRTAGRELNARYLVEGRVQKAVETVRLTVDLIDTEAANAIWSQRFAMSSAELAENPDDFPRIVASEVSEQVMQAETKRALAKSGSFTSWERILRAYSFRSVHGTDTMDKVLEEARQAVAAAPDYALAHAELAMSTMIFSSLSERGDRDAMRGEIRDHINRALQLDGNNGLVLHLVTVASVAVSDGETCLRLARRLVDMRPASPRSYHALATALVALGRLPDTIEALHAQLRCKGFDSSRSIAHYLLGWCYLMEDRLDESEDSLTQGLAFNPHSVVLLRVKAMTEAALGDEMAAVATVRQIREIEPRMTLQHHLNHFKGNPHTRQRMTEHLATFRRLWDATEGGD